MRSRRSVPVFAMALLAAGWAAQACGQEALRVCLDANVPPWSMHHGDESGGFDLRVADAVARRIGRNLAVRWFETERDRDSSTILAVNALLSDGRCRLVGGYPLIESTLGTPNVKSARMPDFEGAGATDRRRSVALGTLVPSPAYHFAALTVVLGTAVASAESSDLASLAGIRLGVEGGTLADATLMLFGGGRLVDQITHVVPGRSELLPRLEQGEYDAALVELRRFDAYRGRNPATQLKASGYYAPVGFNIGFVGLATERGLLDEVNKANADLLAEGELPALAQKAGVTYLPPHEPNVSPDVDLADLRRD